MPQRRRLLGNLHFGVVLSGMECPKTTKSNFSFSALQATADESRAIVVSG